MFCIQFWSFIQISVIYFSTTTWFKCFRIWKLSVLLTLSSISLLCPFKFRWLCVCACVSCVLWPHATLSLLHHRLTGTCSIIRSYAVFFFSSFFIQTLSTTCCSFLFLKQLFSIFHTMKLLVGEPRSSAMAFGGISSPTSGLSTTTTTTANSTNNNTIANNFNYPNECVSEIAQFYRGRSVFITGATGFMGKVRFSRF